MTKPFILDPCCGSKMFYHDKESDAVMFCDIADFRADQKKNKYHNHPDVRGFYYFIPQELYSKYKNEIRATCKEKGAGLIVDGYPITTVLKPKIRKEVKALSDNGYIHYLRLFAKKWVRNRE